MHALAIALSGAAATVGGIVAVFVSMGVERLERLRVADADSSSYLRTLREKARMRVLMYISSLSMAVLLLTPIVSTFVLVTAIANAVTVTLIVLGLFTFAVSNIMFAMVMYNNL